MIRWAQADFDGYVTHAGSSHVMPVDTIALPDGLHPKAAPEHRWVDGAFERRPTLPEPTAETFAGTGVALQFADLPPDTAAEIIDVEDGYSIAILPEIKGTIEIALPDTGRYRIEVTPPRPFLQMIIDIEVPAWP